MNIPALTFTPAAAAAILLVLACACQAHALVNGDFADSADGVPAGWEFQGSCRLVPQGGLHGLPAVEVSSDGAGMNAAVQTLTFQPPRRGGFEVTAWIRIDEADEGGDCGLWVDVIQEDGPPLWAQLGIPKRSDREWQPVRAEIRPTHPVSRATIYLILRGVRGRVRFCDVRMRDLPPEIIYLNAAAAGKLLEVRAGLRDAAPWLLTVQQDGEQELKLQGESNRVVESLELHSEKQVRVILETWLNGAKAARSESVRPGRNIGWDWWVTDSLTRVFQDDIRPAGSARAARIEMARGERESFQLCLRAMGEHLPRVRLEVSKPVNRRGVCAEGSCPVVSWNRVGYVWVEQPFAHPFAARREASWWPDPLLPAGEFTVEEGNTQPLWFTVYAPPGTQPGTYTFTVSVLSEGRILARVPCDVTIYDWSVPVRGYMKTAFALMDWHLSKVYGKIDRKLRRAYTDFLLEHRLNPDDISRTSPPDIRELVHARERGLNAFNVLNVVPEPDPPDSYWVCWAPLEAYTPEFEEQFFKRLDAAVSALDRYGLTGLAYVYGFDERGPEYIPVITRIFGEIKRRYPQICTLSTAWPPPGTDPLALNIDWYAALSSSYDHELARKVRKRGGEMWWYVCMGPRYPYANWLLEEPLIEARLIWWQAFSYDVEGFLYWGLNIWERAGNDRPIPSDAGPRLEWSVTTGGDYSWLNGDGVLLYPGTDGPLGSIRLANIRDGLEDTELLRAFSSKFGTAAVAKVLSRVTEDRTHFSRDPGDLLSSRREMLVRMGGGHLRQGSSLR